MATRMRLDTLEGAEEVEKLRNKGMSETLKIKSKKKIQKYEELLAKYKQVLDDFTNKQSLNIKKEDIKDKITSILENKGVKFNDTKVYFPLDYRGRKKKKKSADVYLRKSYDNAVEFLSSKRAEVMPKRTKKIVERVFPYLENMSVNFSEYPNFSSVANNRTARFSGKWSRL